MGYSLPSTSLLWGKECAASDDEVETSTSTHHESHESNVKDRECKNLAKLIKREGITHDAYNASTSRWPKPSWCKQPSRSSEIDSNEYELDTLLEGTSIVDMEVDVIHT